jgi:hypothetical protein
MKKETLCNQTVHFNEHPITDLSQSEPNDFDITSAETDFLPSFICNGTFMMFWYCQAVIMKIILLPKSSIIDFIEYQCNLVKDPLCWLDQVETLIEVNYELFKETQVKANIHKLYVDIQFLRRQFRQHSSVLNSPQEIINQKKVMEDLTKCTSSDEKKAYLIDLRADLLERNLPNQLDSLIRCIDIEYNRIKKLDKVLGPSRNPKNQSKQLPKKEMIQINGNLNVFVDVFYQLLHEYKPMGKPYLSCSAMAIVNLVVQNFLNNEGENIPESTVLTILSPGKADKRPNNDKRINLC